MKNINIIQVKYINGHKLELKFDDDLTQVIDFSSFLNSSKHPEVKKYLDVNMFNQYKKLFI